MRVVFCFFLGKPVQVLTGALIWFLRSRCWPKKSTNIVFLGSCLNTLTVLLHQHTIVIKDLSETQWSPWGLGDMPFFLLGYLSSVSTFKKVEVIKHFGTLKGLLQIWIHKSQLKGNKNITSVFSLGKICSSLLSSSALFFSPSVQYLDTSYFFSVAVLFPSKDIGQHACFLFACYGIFSQYAALIDRILAESSRYTEQDVFISFGSHISFPDVLIQDSCLGNKILTIPKMLWAQYIETVGESMVEMEGIQNELLFTAQQNSWTSVSLVATF